MLENQKAPEQRVEAEPHIEKEGLFAHIPDGVPVLKNSDVKQKLLQWCAFEANLNETLQIQRFRVKAKVTPDAEEEILAQFFHDERVQSTLSLPAELSATSPMQKQRIQCRKLRVSVTSMSFFDRLVQAGFVSESGALRRCVDEVYDGATASDLLKEMLVNPDSEKLDAVFTADHDQQEFIFHLLRALVIGGSMCQSDESFQPYEDMLKLLYKALISVKKNATDRSVIDVTSRVYWIDDPSVFPSPSRFSTCFAIFDAKKRWLTLWHNHFKPFW